MNVVESVVSIGSPTPLHGVVTEPAVSREPMLVILNAGLLHHVGSCLLSVRLARNAAASGIRTLRIDFSGIGDSADRASALDHEQRCIAETCEVLEYSHKQWGANQFVLSGLCSGAFTAFGASQLDERVMGIIGMAPFGYRTKNWYINHYRDRLLSRRGWSDLGRKLIGMGPSEPSYYDADFIESSASIGWNVPPQEELSASYQTLLNRGVQFLNTFTGGESRYYNYEGQMRDMFPNVDFGSALTECYLPNARHIITEPTYQDHVLAQTQEWLDSNWP